jgi:hypothetical protein
MIYLESQIYGVNFNFRVAAFLKKQTSTKITSVCRPKEQKKKGKNNSKLSDLFPNKILQNCAGIMALLLRWDHYSKTAIQVNVGTELLTFQKCGKLGGGFYHYIASKMGAQFCKSIGVAFNDVGPQLSCEKEEKKKKSPLVRDDSCNDWIKEFQYKMITKINVNDLCPFNQSYVITRDISVRSSAFNEVGPPFAYENEDGNVESTKKRRHEEDDQDSSLPLSKRKK